MIKGKREDYKGKIPKEEAYDCGSGAILGPSAKELRQKLVQL